jgi:hypothetical protein
VNHPKFRDQEAFSGQQVKFESYQIRMHLPFGVDPPGIEKRSCPGGSGNQCLPCFKDFASQMKDQVLKGHLRPGPVDMLISITQVFGLADASVSQRGEHLSNCPGIPWREEEFHRAAFSGQRAFCSHVWSG